MTAAAPALPGIEIDGNALLLHAADGWQCRLPFLWLRDNCPCSECRIAQTSEKRFVLAGVPRDLAPAHVDVVEDELRIGWSDGHRTHYPCGYLRSLGDKEESPYRPWPDESVPPHHDFEGVLHGREAFERGGRRHLQDAYFEFDNVRNNRLVLRRSAAHG